MPATTERGDHSLTGWFAPDANPTVNAELAELCALQTDLLQDGIWYGKTAALAVAARHEGPIHAGSTRFTSAQSTAYGARADLHRSDEHGIPLAWSCWDIALSLVHAIRDTGPYKAWLLDAAGVEVGALAEPHAVVGIQHRTTRNQYIADPYFEVLPMLRVPGATARREGELARATLECRSPVGPKGPDMLTVQHLSYAAAYTYAVAEWLPCDKESMLLDTAPGWAARRGLRVMRARSGGLTFRVAETSSDAHAPDGGTRTRVETKVWVNSSGVGAPAMRRWEHAGWQEAALAAATLVRDGVSSLQELDDALM